MRKRTPTVLVFFAGLLTGGAPLEVAFAQDATDGVTQWEYRVETKAKILALGKMDLATGLNKLGEKGWELVAVDSAYIFKRPKRETRLENLKARITQAEAEVKLWKERVEFSKRLAKKGYRSNQQVQAEEQRLHDAETALDRAKWELRARSKQP